MSRFDKRLVVCLILLAVSAVWLPVAAAAQERIQASVDRAEISEEDQILLQITIEGSRGAEPTLPELPDFDVFSRGQSTQMSFVNGRMSSSVSYSYSLVPKRSGSFQIGSATVELDGEVHSSSPITVRVLAASEQPAESRDLFLSAKVSTRSAFVGQQIVYTWRFYRRVQIGNARVDSMEFDGFTVEDLGEVREFQTKVNGVEYLVSEIRRALFPQEEGNLVIPPSRLSCEVLVRSSRRRRSLIDDVFGSASRQTKVLRTKPIEIEVRTLPTAPPGFSGLVGDFELEAGLSKQELQVGESVTLRLTVKGSGNVQMIGAPELPEMPAFKVYDDKPDGAIERSGATLSGYRSYRKALVPLEAGDLAVPPMSLTFFDPETESFRTARTEALPLVVRPAQGEEELRLTESMAPGTGKVAVRILADDILPPYRGLDAVARRSQTALDRALLLGGLLLPPLGFVGTLMAQRRRRRFALDSGLRRRREALGRARKCLKRIEAQSEGEDSAAASRFASRCLREYVGDKLDVEGSALTPTETEELLRAHGVEEEVVEETCRLLDRLDAAQYSSEKIEPRRMTSVLTPLLKTLDRQIRA
ncbi:MAG: BatD family protein [Thermoanaerobaculia bacterium]